MEGYLVSGHSGFGETLRQSSYQPQENSRKISLFGSGSAGTQQQRFGMADMENEVSHGPKYSFPPGR